jgi:serine/threonine protein kinase
VLEALGETDPERIGPYELVGVLGAGGMGRVYLGRAADGAQAAVKVIHADLARDADFRKRFGREAASTRDLDAPGIARGVASDPEAERPWLATEYVGGRSLHHVAAVHAAGLVHRGVHRIPASASPAPARTASRTSPRAARPPRISGSSPTRAGPGPS